MEYEPQTMSDDDMNERLERFEKEFDIVALSMDIISAKAETVVDALDKRLTEVVHSIEYDTGTLQLKDC